MKKTIYSLICSSLILSLAACGGGGGDSSTASTANDPALQGVWISSTDNHPTGGACGLDIHGAWGVRLTLTFNNGSYTSKAENCISLIGGNTGFYTPSTSGEGTYTTGGVYLETGSPATTMKALDIRNPGLVYSAYNITGTELRLGVPVVGQDGSTPDKRAYIFQAFKDPVFTKQ